MEVEDVPRHVRNVERRIYILLQDDYDQPVPDGDNDGPLLETDIAAQQPCKTGQQEEPGSAKEQELDLRRSDRLRRQPLRLCCDLGDQGGM